MRLALVQQAAGGDGAARRPRRDRRPGLYGTWLDGVTMAPCARSEG
jgi:hypothetical protein